MPDVKKYTKAQVKEHNNENDVWLIINDKIYDVTKFLKEVGSYSFSFSFPWTPISFYLIFIELASRRWRGFDWGGWNGR